MTLKELAKWHEIEGIAAMKRANAASTTECARANLQKEEWHRQANFLLVETIEIVNRGTP